jgi:two-component sensor histidine kinase
MADDRAALARCREQHQLVVELGAFALSGTATLDALLQHAAALAARGTGIARSKVLQYRPEADGLLVRDGVGWRDGVVGKLVMSAAPAEPQGDAFRGAKALVIEDLAATDYRVPEILREHGIVALANVPILVNGSVWGAIEIDSERRGSLEEGDTLLLQGFAHILGRAIEQNAAAAALAATSLERELALKEREVLFRELHHRVANNFTAILGQLDFHARKTAAPEARAAFAALADRVASIVDTHDQLSLSDLEKDISLGVYLTRLVAALPPPENVQVVRAIREATVPIRTAVRLGMIAIELLTNSFKHAFSEAGGTVSVSFTPVPDEGLGRLVVSDNGRGMTAGPPGRSGMRLLKALVAQIDGRYDQSSDGGAGTSTEVLFPLRGKTAP